MPDAPIPKLYGSIAEIREANNAVDQHWFDKDTLRFFDGIVPEDQAIIHGRFFVSSERYDEKSPRLHTLRVVNRKVGIDTLGAFQQFATFDEARDALNDAITVGISVRQVSGPQDPDPTRYHWQVYLGELPIGSADTRAEADALAAEMATVLAGEAPPSNTADYKAPESEPDIFVCERNVLGEILRFEWHGGIYIEVSCPPGEPSEVINVESDATGGVSIDRRQQAFEREVDRWIKTYGPEQLHHDVVEHWAKGPR
jgi:hypothetical protein